MPFAAGRRRHEPGGQPTGRDRDGVGRARNVLPAFVTIDGPVREAIQAHASPGTGRFAASEANGVIARFRALRETDTQDLLNFLRSL